MELRQARAADRRARSVTGDRSRGLGTRRPALLTSHVHTAARAVSFGLALFASIAVIFTAITVLTSGGDDREDRDERGGGMMGGGFGMGSWGPRLVLDLLFPPFPFGYYGYGWFSPPPRMSLPEAIFSFVFGDGDPNVALRAARVRAMAEAIRTNGGALTADALAPFLDPPSAPGAASGSVLVDESWVLPAVMELGGRPEVSDDGTIVYLFDDLTVSALADDAQLVLADPALSDIRELDAPALAELASERAIATSGADSAALRDALRSWAGDQLYELALSGGNLFPDGYVEERKAPFSNAEGGQLFAAGALGLLNLGGAAYLGNLLSTIPPGVTLPGELGALQSLFPFLLAYAVAFVAIPAVRFVRLQASNDAVDERNARRAAWAAALKRPDADLSKRLDAAKRSRKDVRVVRALCATGSAPQAPHHQLRVTSSAPHAPHHTTRVTSSSSAPLPRQCARRASRTRRSAS
jgi:hypothetical protein